MASVLGKRLSIDIRVRPASIGSIVTRPSLRGKSSFGVPSSLANPSTNDEPVRRIDLEDVPVAVRLVAGRPGHVVLDAAAGREVVRREGRRVGRRAPPALELARIGPQLPDALGRRVEFGGQGHGQGVGVLADGGDGHAMGLLRAGDEVGHAVDAAAPQRLVLVEQAARQAQPVDVGPDDLAAAGALLGDQAGPLEHRDVLLHGREAHRVVVGQLGDALARRSGRAARCRAAWRRRVRRRSGRRRRRAALIQPYGCMASAVKRSEGTCTGCRRSRTRPASMMPAVDAVGRNAIDWPRRRVAS